MPRTFSRLILECLIIVGYAIGGLFALCGTLGLIASAVGGSGELLFGSLILLCMGWLPAVISHALYLLRDRLCPPSPPPHRATRIGPIE